jgi:hypothetical protein
VTGTRIIRIWYRDALTAAKGAPTPVPGLYVSENPSVPGEWNITHLASGGAIATRFKDPEHALHIAVKLGPLCDWTIPGVTLRARDDVRRRVWQLLAEEGVMPDGVPVVRYRDLAAMEPLS